VYIAPMADQQDIFRVINIQLDFERVLLLLLLLLLIINNVNNSKIIIPVVSGLLT
jgi:hypothetical protein